MAEALDLLGEPVMRRTAYFTAPAHALRDALQAATQTLLSIANGAGETSDDIRALCSEAGRQARSAVLDFDAANPVSESEVPY